MLDSCTKQFKTDKGCSKYKTYDQFVTLTFGQLNKCCAFSNIFTGIRVCETLISDLGLTQSPARSTMGNDNKNVIGKFMNPCIISGAVGLNLRFI